MGGQIGQWDNEGIFNRFNTTFGSYVCSYIASNLWVITFGLFLFLIPIVPCRFPADVGEQSRTRSSELRNQFSPIMFSRVWRVSSHRKSVVASGWFKMKFKICSLSEHCPEANRVGMVRFQIEVHSVEWRCIMVALKRDWITVCLKEGYTYFTRENLTCLWCSSHLLAYMESRPLCLIDVVTFKKGTICWLVNNLM